MLCVGIVVAYCFTSAPAPATQGATFCQVYKPIYWGENDTRKTKEQADSLNRTWKRLCKK